MKLYGSLTSPYVRKVRALAHELGIGLRLQLVAVHDLTDTAYGRINPVHRIPALELDDGSLVFDSRVIGDYLQRLASGGQAPAADAEHWRLRNLQVLGDGLMDAAVPLIQELQRPAERQWAPRIAEYRRSIRQILDALEADAATLPDTGLAALAIACGLEYLDFRFPDDPWRPTRPDLAAWCRLQSARPALQATAPPK